MYIARFIVLFEHSMLHMDKYIFPAFFFLIKKCEKAENGGARIGMKKRAPKFHLLWQNDAHISIQTLLF